MWTHWVYSFCLVALCGAQISDFERYLLSLNATPGQTSTETTVKTNEKTCDSSDGPGVCMKRSDCSVDAPKVDPATSFVPREGTIGGDSTSFDNTIKQECDWLKVCCPRHKRLAEPKVVKFQQPSGCGYSNPGANILREKTNAYGYADFGDFPWMVALMVKKNEANKKFADEYIGGGSLIHPAVVMTAAHKVYGLSSPSALKCRAGEWDTNTEDEFYKHQDRDVKKIVIHDQYLNAYQHNNIALLILERPFELEDSPHIGIACLEPSLPPPGTSCYSMGWGKDFMNENKYAVVLKKIKLNLVEGNQCQNQYRNSKLGRTYKLDLSLTCAGGEPNVDTCVGDGGSSLVCQIEDKQKDKLRYSVVGMVAYGLECGTGNLPGVYVKIPHVYEWVITEMTVQGFNSSTFIY